MTTQPSSAVLTAEELSECEAWLDQTWFNPGEREKFQRLVAAARASLASGWRDRVFVCPDCGWSPQGHVIDNTGDCLPECWCKPENYPPVAPPTTAQDLDKAQVALERLTSRKDENVDAWAESLAADLVAAGEAETPSLTSERLKLERMLQRVLLNQRDALKVQPSPPPVSADVGELVEQAAEEGLFEVADKLKDQADALLTMQRERDAWKAKCHKMWDERDKPFTDAAKANVRLVDTKAKLTAATGEIERLRRCLVSALKQEIARSGHEGKGDSATTRIIRAALSPTAPQEGGT